MDLFAAIVFIGIAAMIGAFLLLGRMGHRTSDITDKKDRERWGTQAVIEERDVGQMIDGQNAYRRRHGEPVLTEEQVRGEVARQERGRLDEAD